MEGIPEVKSFVDISHDTMEFEILHRLDLPTVLSLSFACSSLNLFLNKDRFILNKIINESRLGRPPIWTLLRSCAELNFDDLSAYFTQMFGASVKALSVAEFDEILSKFLECGCLKSISVTESLRFLVFDKNHFELAARFGSVDFIHTIAARGGMTIEFLTPHILAGAAHKGHTHILEWIDKSFPTGTLRPRSYDLVWNTSLYRPCALSSDLL
jgi:hypothetical protein